MEEPAGRLLLPAGRLLVRGDFPTLENPDNEPARMEEQTLNNTENPKNGGASFGEPRQ